MTIIVTGASGFIGHKVMEELLRRGLNACAVSRKPVKFKNSLIVDDYLQTPSGDILIHLADNPNRIKVNQIGDNYLNEAKFLASKLILKDYKRIFFASSAVVYGDNDERPHKPKDEVFASDIYSRSKLECEELFLTHNNSVIARFSNLYGFGMSAENVVTKIINQLVSSNQIRIWNDKPIRDFLWIDDAVNAIIEMALGTSKGVYNVAAGRSTSIHELINTAIKVSNNYSHFNIKVTQPSDKNSSILLDISDTIDSFNWLPNVKLEDGIKLLLNKKTRT